MGIKEKKIIAPIIVTIIIIIYYIAYFGLLFTFLNGIWKYIFGIFPVLFSCIMVKVCVERIKEIKEGEEDDISQY